MKLTSLTRLRKRPQTPQPAPGRALIINGNPDPRPERFCAAVCAAFADGIQEAGGRVRRLDIGKMNLPLDAAVWRSATPSLRAELAQALEQFSWADRLFVVFPMWLAQAQAQLSMLFEELARQREPEIRVRKAIGVVEEEKQAHVVVTTNLPSLLYHARAGKAGSGWMVSFPGLRMLDTTIIGSIEAITHEERIRWLRWVHCRGAAGSAVRATH
jgi:putative NADPH-quinone reductase